MRDYNKYYYNIDYKIYKNDNYKTNKEINYSPDIKSYGRIYYDEQLKKLLSRLNKNQITCLTYILNRAIAAGINVDINSVILIINLILNSPSQSIDKLSKNNDLKIKSNDSIDDLRKLEEEKRRETDRIITKFLADITQRGSNNNFRGWVLPNGLLLSQFNETSEISDDPKRQDHSSLVKIFIEGLKEYDFDMYQKIISLYDEYMRELGVSGDYSESFAVERLGWMQVSVFGQKIIAYRGDRWQDRILSPFFNEYGFKYTIYNSGKDYDYRFDKLYDHINEIIKLGLKGKYSRKLN